MENQQKVRDEDYVSSMEEYIRQRELSIAHSKHIIESCEKQKEIHTMMIASAKKQIEFDTWTIERQRKILQEYSENSK